MTRVKPKSSGRRPGIPGYKPPGKPTLQGAYKKKLDASGGGGERPRPSKPQRKLFRKMRRAIRKIRPRPMPGRPGPGGRPIKPIRPRPMPGRPGPTTPGGRPIKPSEPSGGTRVRLPKPTPHYGPAKKRPPRMGPGFPGGGPIKPGGPKTRNIRNMPGPRPKGGKKIAEFTQNRRRARGRRRRR
jgi:hypothetical protein